jgi:hypothetical protein
VQGGKSYLVGEGGPEIFKPQSSGRVINTLETVRQIKTQALAGAAGQTAGRSTTINAPVTINVQAAQGQSVAAIAEAVERIFSRKLSQLSHDAYSDGAN